MQSAFNDIKLIVSEYAFTDAPWLCLPLCQLVWMTMRELLRIRFVEASHCNPSQISLHRTVNASASTPLLFFTTVSQDLDCITLTPDQDLNASMHAASLDNIPPKVVQSLVVV